jgi:exodeoxyribonuclease VII large subunit
LPAVIWRTTAAGLRSKPAVGMEVIVSGKLSVYAPHGRYQFIINSLQDAGQGQLFLEYEELKKRLISEGLCEANKKQSIPKYPLHVGLVTSSTGAALQDMLRVFAQDAPHVKLTLSSARVQGKGGAETIIGALEALIPQKPDCVLLTRGGGSIEDLWEFNRENLARYVADYPIPVISGVGHETDTTIIDLVSDYRASTPTNAAEFICAPWREVKLTLNQMDYTLATAMNRVLDRERLRLNNVQRYLSSRRISESILNYRQAIQQLQNSSIKGLLNHFALKISKFQGLKGKLIAYSPQNILKKGYTLIYDRGDKLIRSVKDLSRNDSVSITFHDGSIHALITDDKGNNNE